MTCYESLNLIIQGIVGLAILSTFIIYFLQLSTMRKSSKSQNILSVINFIQERDVRDARKLAITKLKPDKYSSWTDGDKDKASLVCSNYEVLAILILEGKYVPDNIFLEYWGPSIIKCFENLKPHIKEMQKPENSGLKYWSNFELLYNAVINHMKNK
jgi:hypothetical protein